MNDTESDIASTIVMDQRRIYDKLGNSFSPDQATTFGCFASHIDKKSGRTMGHFPDEYYEDNEEDDMVKSMAEAFITETDESKHEGDDDDGDEGDEGDEEDEEKPVGQDKERVANIRITQLASGTLVVSGKTAGGKIETIDGAFIVKQLADALIEQGDELSATALIDVARKNVHTGKLNTLYIAVDRLFELGQPTLKKTEMVAKKKTVNSLLANAWATKDYRTGSYSANKNDATDYLDYCEANLISLDEFKRAKDSSEISVDFDKAVKEIKQAGVNTDKLQALGKHFASILNSSDNESMKTAYVLGQGMFLYSMPTIHLSILQATNTHT